MRCLGEHRCLGSPWRIGRDWQSGGGAAAKRKACASSLRRPPHDFGALASLAIEPPTEYAALRALLSPWLRRASPCCFLYLTPLELARRTGAAALMADTPGRHPRRRRVEDGGFDHARLDVPYCRHADAVDHACEAPGGEGSDRTARQVGH